MNGLSGLEKRIISNMMTFENISITKKQLNDFLRVTIYPEIFFENQKDAFETWNECFLNGIENFKQPRARLYYWGRNPKKLNTVRVTLFKSVSRLINNGYIIQENDNLRLNYSLLNDFKGNPITVTILTEIKDKMIKEKEELKSELIYQYGPVNKDIKHEKPKKIIYI